MQHDHVFLGSALMTDSGPSRLTEPSPCRWEAERPAFERLGVRRRTIETPTLRMALPSSLPGHVD